MASYNNVRWFIIIASLVIFLGFILAVSTAIYLYNVNHSNNFNNFNKNDTLMWLNIVMAIIFALIFFWSLWVLISTAEVVQPAHLTSSYAAPRRSVVVTASSPVSVPVISSNTCMR